MDSDWVFPLWIIAIGTMTLGNLLAITQHSVKRMLAYSSIAHAGYLLIPIVVGVEWGGMPLLFYLLTYSFMTIGAFAVLSSMAEVDEPRDSYSDFAGLGFKRPFLALAMTLFMLSLAGFPPLAGFTGKFHVFRSAVLSGHLDLAIIGVLNSLLSVIFYLRVIVAMYMEEGGAEGKIVSPSAVRLHRHRHRAGRHHLCGYSAGRCPRLEPNGLQLVGIILIHHEGTKFGTLIIRTLRVLRAFVVKIISAFKITG